MRNLTGPQEEGKAEIKEGSEESGDLFSTGFFMDKTNFQIQTIIVETTIFNPPLGGTHCDLWPA